MKQYLVDAFTDQVFAGNPAAICILDRWLPEDLMQKITRENNLSETAFAVKTGETYHLRWFTPGGEIDLCGHATLACAFVILTQLEPNGDRVSFDTLSGRLTVQRKGDLFEMDFPAYELTKVPVTPAMTEALGAQPSAAYLGRDLLCVFEDEATVRTMTPDLDKVKALDGLLHHVTAPGAGERLRLPVLLPQVRHPRGPGVRLRPLPHCPLLGQGSGPGGAGGLAGLAPGRNPLLHAGGKPGEAGGQGRPVLPGRDFPPQPRLKTKGQIEMTKTIFFDLDGTLTDSGPGIMNCAKLALDHFGIPVENQAQLRAFVGPPLRISFEGYGLDPDQVQEAIRVFRSRYVPIGKFENEPYPGIGELLARLQGEGHRLYVATSKPEVTAREVLEHFGLDGYFAEICGADLKNKRDTKDQVIAYLFSKVGQLDNVVMVGDTNYDVTGAAVFGIPTIGVSWGYGSPESMTQAGAVAIAHTMDELHEILNRDT